MKLKKDINLPIDILKPLITSVRLEQCIVELARRIATDYNTSEIIAVCLLKGSFMFFSDLIRQIHKYDIPLFVDFMCVSSYGVNTESSGSVCLLQDVTMDIEGRPVLLVDDIIDTGRTLQFSHRHLMTKQPGLIKTCVLLDKPARRIAPLKADYIGFTVPDVFIVGYGLDHKGRYRELPYISILSD